MPPSRRPGLSALLVAGAVVLVVSIMVGQMLGDRVLLQTTRRSAIVPSVVTPVPEADSGDHGELKNWKRLQVVSVATDPAFPDPRVTRPPTPPPPPPMTPRPTPSPRPVAPRGIYTSPPLPIPLVSHEPGAGETDSPTVPPEAPPQPR